MTQNFVVGSEADFNAALAQIDVEGASSAPGSAYTIALSADIALTSDLLAINLVTGSTLAISGMGHVLDGGGHYHGLLDYAGQVTVDNLAINDAVSTGGSGGGGGAGLGGGLFVAANGAVVLSNVTFGHDGAVGGASSLTLTGGGGLDGGAGLGGGGGVGLQASGAGASAPGAAPGAGEVAGAPGGGSTSAQQGGAAGGGGAAGLPAGLGSSASGGGAGGGVGGSNGLAGDAATRGNGGDGGYGGFGGGGGSGGSAAVGNGGGAAGIGGNGGFGGGGGTSGVGHYVNGGGNGGFGGGGGASQQSSSQSFFQGANGGSAGFGGGTNAVQNLPPYTSGTEGGGGGLGAGGAIFVQQGGSLTYAAGTESGGSVAGGAGAGPNPTAGNGLALGSGIFIQGNNQVTLSATAAQTLTISDVIADQTGSTHQTGMSAAGDPLAGAGSVLVSGPGTVILDAANTYSGGTTLTAGTLELQVQGAAGSGPIQFAGDGSLRYVAMAGPVLVVDSGALPSATPITGFVANDGIVLEGVAYAASDTVSVSGNVTTVHAGGESYSFNIVGGGMATLMASGDGSVLLGEAPCYAAGTRIDTPGGEACVEALRAGDLVSLAAGGAAVVRWVGHRRVDLRRHPKPSASRPVRVRAGSFGAGLPRRDLVLSPEHALFLDGVLVPVHLLVDGRCVVQEAWERVTYHHVELERHDVMLAEGLAAESYLDTGNRAQFAQGALASLHPQFGPGEVPAVACAPLALFGPVVEAARARLRAAVLEAAA